MSMEIKTKTQEIRMGKYFFTALYHLCDNNLSCSKWLNEQISLMPYIQV